jgi:leucyl aminopeptidase
MARADGGPTTKGDVMKVDVSVKAPVSATGDALVLERYVDEDGLGAEARRVDAALGGLLGLALRDQRFEARAAEVADLHTGGRFPVKRVLVVGLGPRRECTAETIRRAAAAVARRARDLAAASLTIPALGARAPGLGTLARAQATVEGALLGLYRFDRYKEKRNGDRALAALTLLVPTARERDAARQGLRGAELAAEATCFARDLINAPANHVTATALADAARAIAREAGLRVRILDRAACEKMGMGAFLGVNMGSVEPPRFIHLAYVPGRTARRRVALIGKGITFDSGGLDLKTTEGMATMKGDMSGAAAVLGVLKVLPRLRPAVEVHGLVAATDNMPSGSATKPGDVLRAMNGKTIEVNNTDAEGRLTLADAIAYARKEVKPDEIVDIATLTGAASIALGSLCAAALSNNGALQTRVLAAGARAGERLWPLPMIDEYREGLRSEVADLRNTGPRPGGAITAGLFIREFAGNTPWVHLDIAGAAFTDKDLPYAAKGGVGFGVRTLLEYVLAAGRAAR